MHRTHWLTPLLCGVLAVVAWSPLRAQSSQDHAYTSQDIETGSRLYSAQCNLCHGPNGDGIQGVNLRRGQFRQPMSDDQLRRTITVGVPGTGMPPFKLQSNELDGLVAFIRAGFDMGEIGRAACRDRV